MSYVVAPFVSCNPKLLQMIFGFFGEAFIKALAQTEALIREGYTIVRGIVLMSCGPAVRFHDSFARLRALVDE